MSLHIPTPVSGLGNILTSPYIIGPVVAILRKLPQQSRERLAASLSKYHASLGTVEKAAWLLLVFGLLRSLNRSLNRIAMNNWHIRARQDWDWPKEVAIVTGGSSGIGEQLVIGLVQKGVNVAVLDLQPPSSDLKAAGASFYECDVTSEESVHQAADAVRRDLGHPSILINNAGIHRSVAILKTTDANVRKVFEVNTISHWTLVREFAPHMVQQNKGHIVTIASVASFVALPTGADYSASKVAALAFHEALTCELKTVYKSPGVLTSIVHPNFVRTPLIESISNRLEEDGVVLLTSEAVANTVLAQVFQRQGGQLIIPKSSSFLSTLRAWPNWVQEFFRDRMGFASATHLGNS